MADHVKRSYASPLRAEQALHTRRVVVAAAARLFADASYGATTIDDVAAAAGVSRKTVFTSVGGKLDLLKLAIDWATTGDDEDAPLLQREQTARVADHPNPAVILARWATASTAISVRVAGLSMALTVAAGIDPEAQALREQTQAQRLKGMRAFVDAAAERGAFRPDLDAKEAADILWLLSDPLLYQKLVNERGWSKQRFERWLTSTITAQLIP